MSHKDKCNGNFILNYMRVAMTGANGFIGTNVRRELEKIGIEVVSITRRDFDKKILKLKLQFCDGIIHLAGESIGGVWTEAKRKRIYESRVVTANLLVDSAITLKDKIRFFVTISGVGIYDCKHRHNESSSNFSDGFLAVVIRDWEAEVRQLQRSDIKTVVIRTGVVLGARAGILSVLSIPFRNRIGFTIISDNYFPVIHIVDLAGIFLKVVTDRSIEGIINAVTPVGITISAFFSLLGKRYNPWFMLKINKKALRCVMGESSILLTEGQDVIPERLMEMRYEFKFATAEGALKDVLKRRREA
jgi:uncharacterized protein (TIGR01777 family)